MKITEPKHELEAFTCPHLDCGVYSRMLWCEVHKLPKISSGSYTNMSELSLAICHHCKNYSIWLDGSMIFPETISVHEPNIDLDEDIKKVYLEGALILNKSPRGAAAILRLAIQLLCIQLGEKGKNLNTDIKNLVKKGLPKKIQQALDSVRVIGNNAVHPGSLDMSDNISVAKKLFELLNMVADVMITKPKEVEQLYSTLPESSLESIEKRDS